MKELYFNETKAVWNSLPQLYAERFDDISLYQNGFDFLLQHIPQQSTLLEIGCGPGNVTQYIHQQRPDLVITATDFAENMLNFAQNRFPIIQFNQLDIRDLNTITETYHSILVSFCIPYINANEVQQFFQVAHGKLEQNGLLYLSYVDDKHEKSGYQTNSKGQKMFFNYYEKKELVVWAQNFEVIFEETIVYPKGESIEKHIALIFRKLETSL